jgi:antitoxin ParD1/3/4
LKFILELLPNFGTFTEIFKIMRRNTSVALGNYFEDFVENRISEGRYKNASEVIRAGLRLLEEEENRVIALRTAIKEGLESGIAKDFNPKKHLASLKANKRKNG